MPGYSYLFDVDGTLTPHGEGIEKDFFLWFIQWIEGKTFFLVSSLDYGQLYDKIGPAILNAANGVFASSGKDVYIQGKRVMHHEMPEHENDKAQIADLLRYPVIFFGDHIVDHGDDFSLSYEILTRGGNVIPVSNWQDTQKALIRIEERLRGL